VADRGKSWRRAGERDLGQLTELWIEITTHHGRIEPLFTLRRDADSEIRRLLASQLRDPDTAIFVWEAERELLGFCGVRIDIARPILAETRRAEVVDLGVRAGARRRGIGRALAAAAIDWVRERGIDRVEVRVAVGNREGQEFWRALGFGDLMDVLHRRL
jgi:ribosomal protein S18 acetylase RimI-like enzyme